MGIVAGNGVGFQLESRDVVQVYEQCPHRGISLVRNCTARSTMVYKVENINYDKARKTRPGRRGENARLDDC